MRVHTRRRRRGIALGVLLAGMMSGLVVSQADARPLLRTMTPGHGPDWTRAHGARPQLSIPPRVAASTLPHASAPSQRLHLDTPFYLAIDARSNVYAGELQASVLVKISPDGAQRTILHTFAHQSPFSGNGHDGIYGIAVDRHNTIYVGNANTDTIVKVSPRGAVLATWGGYGSHPGQIDWPEGVALDRQNAVYVADANNSRIEKFSATGRLLAVWGRSGTGRGQFDRVTGLAVDPRGDIWVCDIGNDRIQELSPTGKTLAVYGTQGTDPGQFDHPEGLAVDARGAVYVVDGGNNRIQKLRVGAKAFTVWVNLVNLPAPTGGDTGGVAVDAQGNVYLSPGGGGSTITKLSPTGRVLAMWQ